MIALGYLLSCSFLSLVKKIKLWTSLVVSWLGLHLPRQEGLAQTLARELGSHIPFGQKAQAWSGNKVVENSIKTKKKKKKTTLQ